MQSFDEEGDVFFDSYDNIRTSIDSSSSEGSVAKDHELDFRKFDYEFFTRELLSVRERRNRFLQGMGLDEFVSSLVASSHDLEETMNDRSSEMMGLERITESSGAVLDCLSSQNSGICVDSDCCIRDLDSGKRFIVQDSMLKEDGSDKLMTLKEFEKLLGLSCFVQRLMQRVVSPSVVEHNKGVNVHKKKFRNWWNSITKKRCGMEMCKNDVSVKNSQLPRIKRTRVHQHSAKCLDFTALYVGQEIQAHKGLIRSMKFSQCGWYLASGGEDCVVRIWQVREMESSCRCCSADGSSKFIDRINDRKPIFRNKGSNPAPIVIPKKVFKIEETPLHEFRGHTSDVLDISWSNADCLITSSKDKTVRMWKVGCARCLKVFQHNDYVTCIQFNPVDDRYFISGSIDGKVRVWGVSENRVVDWADIRDIVTAVCYRPDGKGFIVGSMTGNCRFYDYTGDNMQLETQFCVQGKKKSTCKRITGLQFSPEDSQRVMVSSADSKVRIFDGVAVIHKFKGLRRTKSHLSATFTSDGRYIVSVGEDSSVYVWNYSASRSSPAKGAKSIQSCQRFYSEGVSVAVPWPGTDNIGGLSNGSPHPPSPSPLLKIIEPSAKDSDRCYLGTLFFVDGLSRGSATWPEEKLLPSPLRVDDDLHHHCHQGNRCRCLTSPSTSWSLVTVTASCDGYIRSYHNHGLPVRL